MVSRQELVKRFVEQVQDDKAPRVSEEEKIRAGIIAALDDLGKLTVPEDGVIFEGDKLIAPEQFAGDIPGLVEYLEKYNEGLNAEFDINRTFPYRPFDGANAFQEVLKRVWGTSGIGKVTWTMFGPQRPEYHTVECGVGKNLQVPWGRVAYEPLNATFDLGARRDAEKGVLFHISATAPKRHRGRVEAIFQLIEEHLRSHSIYRGKAITAAEQPGFVPVDNLNPDSVVYSQDVIDKLDANVWSVIDYTDTYREQGLKLKRAVLLEGPHGTGKTLAGVLTAQHAVAHGWTYILVRPEDDVLDALKTAVLYAPAVVQIEDIEKVAGVEGQTAQFMSKVLDVLDSASNKHVDVVTVFTTNNVESIHRGALRPGRLDAVITIGNLDAQGFERLVRSTIRPQMLGEVDFVKVAEAMRGFLPSFVVEASTRALRYSIARGKGKPTAISTVDLVHSADALRPQLLLHENARALEPPDPMEQRLSRLLAKGFGEAMRDDLLDDDWYDQQVEQGVLPREVD